MASRAALTARLAAAGALVSAALLPHAQAQTASVANLSRCNGVVASPTFASDGTAFCAAVFPTSTAATLKLYVTHDHARSWTTVVPSGFAATSPLIRQFLISPEFVSDRMLVIELAGGDVYYSLDSGNSFTKAPTPLGAGRLALVPSATPALPVAAPEAIPVRHAAILSALATGSAGQNDSYIFDPVTPNLRLVGGTTDLDEAFFPSPAYSQDHVAYAVGSIGDTPTTSHAELFSCTPTFACPTKVFTFAAPNTWVDQLQYAPDYATSKTIVVTVTSNVTERYQVLVSHDGGAHFSSATTVQQALNRLYASGGVGTVSVASGPPGTTSLFAYITGGDGRKHGPPADQLYRSDDDGRSWKLAAYNHCQCGATGRVGLPYGSIYGSRAGSITPPGILTAAGTKMLLTSLWTPRNSYPIRTVWCSSDLGRTWITPCS